MSTFTKPIFLVGPMGAGKTTIGKLLAQSLSGSFLDHDDYIIEQAKMSIPDIFAKYGEAHFRQLEHDCLASLLNPNSSYEHIKKPDTMPLVIAGGGGIAQRADNRELIKEHSLCLYLYLDVEHQYDRVKDDTNRPMIHVSDIKTRLSDLFSVRDPQFREIALAIIDTNNDKESIVNQALEVLEPFKKN